ncbi:hypothetical protein QR680_007494 [Steinernema hermaphroditum]|uniref:RNA-directed RNA polymerase n=1 Tax=Steinernema hermaphroditum TaxID=289476 RepID=A0AA39M6H3_9BILA|nr:hypothetical protein QR680_007494 [Steinernema hermaphroditum]
MNLSGVSLTSVLVVLFLQGAFCIFEEHFDHQISPCNDLFGHVCNLSPTASDTFQERHRKMLLDTAYDKVIVDIYDEVYNDIAREIERGAAKNIEACYEENAKSSFDPRGGFDEGRMLGRMIVSGKVKNAELACKKDVECSVKFPGDRMAIHLGKMSTAPAFIRGIFDTYLEHVDVRTGEMNMRRKDFNVRYPLMRDRKELKVVIIHDLDDFERIDSSGEFRKPLHEALFKSHRFAPYFNLLYSHKMIGKNVLLSEKDRKDLEALFTLIKGEIKDVVSNSWTTDEHSRQSILEHLDELPNVFGLPRGLQNETLLESFIKEYKRVFFSNEVRAKLDSMKYCTLEGIAQVIARLFNRFVFENTNERIFALNDRNYEESVFQFNAFYHPFTGLHFLPAFVHIIKNDLPLGMKYGILASTMGHELFHALGLSLSSCSSKTHLLHVQKSPFYKDAVECYQHYYGSFGVRVDGVDKCPNGTLKAEEGFADVEGSRVAYRVLKKALAARNHPRQKRSTSSVYYPTFNAVPISHVKASYLMSDKNGHITEEQMFFIAHALSHCIRDHKDDAKIFEKYENEEHPRPSSRANAMVRQLEGFTEAFSCTPRDKLFATSCRCELYPLMSKPKPSIGAWKKECNELGCASSNAAIMEHDDGKRRFVEGQVKVQAESLAPGARAVFNSDDEVRCFMDTVIYGLSRGCPPTLLKTGTHVPKRLVSREFDPDYQEFSVDVEALDWEKALFRLVDNFFSASKLFRNTSNRPDVAALLQLSNFNLLKRDFVPSDSGIPAEFFCLGNLLSPFHFINHFKLSEDNVSLDLLNECEKMKNNTHGILVDFEHDRNLLKVRFGYATKPTKTSIEWQEAVVYVHVTYGAIRRIVVDWESVTDTDIEGCKIYLHLNWPVEIKKAKKKDRGWQHTERFLSWDLNAVPPKAISDCPVLMVAFPKIAKAQLYNCLSRLRARCNLVLEFCTVRSENAAPYVPSPMADEKLKRIIVKYECYGLGYLIEALSSRGAVVNDHLLTSISARNTFINKVLNAFEENKQVTLESLERMLNTLDEHLEIRSLNRVFDRIHEKVNAERLALQEEEDAQKKEGFQRVRKVVITPTRKLLVVPELLMGNRFLRTHDESGDQTLRVQFRDDDSQHMRGIKCGSFLIERTVGEALRNGVVVAGRLYKYMGSSNSQMRDNGCYFFNADTGENIHEKIRAQFGKFDTDNIPKFMSRFGQCFTQARRSDVTLERAMYKRVADVCGGDDKSHKEYTFSDGVGNISYSYAAKISEDMDLDGCIRFRGIKGIVCVNPYLDITKKFVERFKLIEKQQEDNRMDCDIHFRPSQEKFKAPRDERIEIVKYSAPTPMSLNRPMINIMDQVTAMQNQATHNRLCSRVHELLDIQLESLGKCLTDENKARERLNELPRRIDFGYLSSEKGFIVTEEPFFRSLLQSCVQYTLKKLRTKIQVQIPATQGRMLFGVIDESGLLQYGQIFCQVTSSIIVKTPSKSAAKEVLQGPVLMTKNPSIVAGDVRMFEAVDIPELHHLVDVIVFPRYGPRPHPDEMAGSDLDGDEYAIMWDPQLFFDRNEDPLDFPKPVVKTDPNDDRDVNTKMIDFYISYIEQDSIGTIANSFLVMSDLYGIDSPVCIAIAKKHSLAVDFPKTGKPPEKLSRRPRNGMPPEQPDRFPDFMERDNAPAYISSSLNGQLYRRAKEIDGVLAQAMDRQLSSAILEDPDLIVEGFEQYIDNAFILVNAYNASMSALLDNYGIADEAQAFTGAIIKCRNRISDKDNDDMSMFNTNFVVEQRVNRIFQRARHAFFDEFGGFENCTVDEFAVRSKNLVTMMQEGDLDRRYCKSPTIQMKQKASACYKACYWLAKDADRRFLSFAWICWDVLAEIKRENHFNKADRQLGMGMPLHSRLHKYVIEFVSDRSQSREFQQYRDEVFRYQPFVAVYANAFQGLYELCFLLKKWGDEHDLFNCEFTPECLNALLLLHGIDEFPKRRNDAKTEWLEKVTNPGVRVIPKNLLSRIGGLGVILLDFLKFLGSRDFKQFNCISLSPLNSSEFLLGDVCKAVSRAAYHTYYHITFSGMFESLPHLDADDIRESTDDLKADGRRLYEIEPFAIELPFGKEREHQAIIKNVRKMTGVHHLTMRKMKDDHRTRTVKMIVSGVGTLDSLEKLREVMAVKPNMRTGGNCIIAKANLMADMVYEKIRYQTKKNGKLAEEHKFDLNMISEIGKIRVREANEDKEVDEEDQQHPQRPRARRQEAEQRQQGPAESDAAGSSNPRPPHHRAFRNNGDRFKQRRTLAELRNVS